MNTRTSLLGAAMNFAHLAGIGAGKKAKAKPAATDDQDEDDKPDAEDDEEQDPPPAKKGKKAKRAEDDDDQAGDDEDDDDKPAASGDNEEDAADDDEGEEDDEDPPPSNKKAKGKSAEYRRGVSAERRRCAAIFGVQAAARNIPLAASLAFETNMSAAAAIKVLKGQSGSAPAGGDRSRRNPDLGADPGSQGASSSIKKAWGAAIDKVAPKAARSGSGWGSAIERAQR